MVLTSGWFVCANGERSTHNINIFYYVKGITRQRHRLTYFDVTTAERSECTVVNIKTTSQGKIKIKRFIALFGLSFFYSFSLFVLNEWASCCCSSFLVFPAPSSENFSRLHREAGKIVILEIRDEGRRRRRRCWFDLVYSSVRLYYTDGPLFLSLAPLGPVRYSMLPLFRGPRWGLRERKRKKRNLFTSGPLFLWWGCWVDLVGSFFDFLSPSKRFFFRVHGVKINSF